MWKRVHTQISKIINALVEFQSPLTIVSSTVIHVQELSPIFFTTEIQQFAKKTKNSAAKSFKTKTCRTFEFALGKLSQRVSWFQKHFALTAFLKKYPRYKLRISKEDTESLELTC
jgi:hypothetical protein